MFTIYKRELKSFFYSPIAYSVIGFFVMVTALFFWMNNIMGESPMFTSVLSSVSLMLVFIVPILTMKLLAEEKKNGTEVLLRTSTVSISGIVYGKFLSALTVFCIMTCITIIFPIIMMTRGTIPIAATVGSYIGFILLGASFISIGVLMSSMTENQVVAAISGFVILLTMFLLQVISSFLGGIIGQAMNWVSLVARYNDFSQGIFNLTSVIFYISFTMVILFITIKNIERRRWSQG